MIYEKYHYDQLEDKLHIEQVQDVQPILEANKRAFNDSSGFKSEVFNKKASIPTVVLMDWLKRNGLTYQDFMNDEKVLKRFLNDPDHKFCLTRPGKI